MNFNFWSLYSNLNFDPGQPIWYVLNSFYILLQLLKLKYCLGTPTKPQLMDPSLLYLYTIVLALFFERGNCFSASYSVALVGKSNTMLNFKVGIFSLLMRLLRQMKLSITSKSTATWDVRFKSIILICSRQSTLEFRSICLYMLFSDPILLRSMNWQFSVPTIHS